MVDLGRNVRFYILLVSVGLSIGLGIRFNWVLSHQLTDVYAMLGLVYLYVALLIGPVIKIFPRFDRQSKLFKSRRAIGVGAFYFGLLHSLISFFNQLGGFEGLFYLTNGYLVAIGLGLVGLMILALLAVTSFDRVIERMGFKRWKWLHRWIYLAGVVVLVHGVMLGNYLSDTQSIVARIVYIATAVLWWAEAWRFDEWLQQRGWQWRFGIGQGLVLVMMVGGGVIWWWPLGGANLGIHGWHIQLAREAAQNQSNNLPVSLQGDKNLRFTVSMDPVEQILPNQPVTLRFRVNNAGNGNPVGIFNQPYEKPMHLIVLNNEMSFFEHLHPEQQDLDFVITTQFPKADVYRIYLDFQPLGGIEQQVAFRVNVGTDLAPFSSQQVDQNLTKEVGGYEITLEDPKLVASQMSLGQQRLRFTIKNGLGQPVTTLKPYLASFGHLVMINQQTYDYIHVHPASTRAPLPNENGGPVVEFLPIGIYGPFKPGIYRLFGQFNPDGKLIMADFTVKVE